MQEKSAIIISTAEVQALQECDNCGIEEVHWHCAGANLLALQALQRCNASWHGRSALALHKFKRFGTEKMHWHCKSASIWAFKKCRHRKHTNILALKKCLGIEKVQAFWH